MLILMSINKQLMSVTKLAIFFTYLTTEIENSNPGVRPIILTDHFTDDRSEFDSIFQRYHLARYLIDSGKFLFQLTAVRTDQPVRSFRWIPPRRHREIFSF